MKKQVKILGQFLLLIATSISCIHTKFEEPEFEDIPIGNILTIEQLYQIYTDSALMKGKLSYKFENDYSVYANITMDDKSGNIYKSAFVQDAGKGVNLHLLSSGGLYEGDSIRIYLKGLTLSEYAGLLQIDSVHVDKNIVKIATNRNVSPQKITIDQINTGLYTAKLVKLENVQFIDNDLNKTFADATNKISQNRTLIDANNQTIIVRTSGYASFASSVIPSGRGSIIAIVSKFNSDWQLLIRNLADINFNLRRFGDVDTLFSENFANIENGTVFNFSGWQNIASIGSLLWKGFNNGEGADYVKIDNSSASEATTYLILPKLNLSGAKISFKTRAGMLLNAKLELVVSTNYNPSEPVENATWTVVNTNIATATPSSYGNWLDSGETNLSSFGDNAYIAFRFKAQTGEKGIYLIDDILIYKQ